MSVYAVNAILIDDDESKTYLVESDSMTGAIETVMKRRGSEINKIMGVELWEDWELLVDNDVEDNAFRRLLGG